MSMRLEDLDATERLTLQLAKAALIAYMGDAHTTALKAVQRIGDECGGEAVDLAMCAWIDWTAGALGIRGAGRDVQVAFAGHDADGTITRVATDAPAARPELGWAGRLIGARIGMDAAAYRALIGELPDGDPGAVGRHVAAVLEMCALTMTAAGVTP